MCDDRSTVPCNAPLQGGLWTPAAEMQKISIEKWCFNEERFFLSGKIKTSKNNHGAMPSLVRRVTACQALRKICRQFVKQA
jgi:hypothetical protein